MEQRQWGVGLEKYGWEKSGSGSWLSQRIGTDPGKKVKLERHRSWSGERQRAENMGRLLDVKEMEDTTGWTWLSSGSGSLNTTLLGASGRAGISLFEGGHLRPNYREGTQTLPPPENWIKDLSTHQSKILMPSQPVPPIRKLPQASYHYPSEGRQNENHNHRKLIKLITWTTALSNSIKIWAMPCRAT